MVVVMVVVVVAVVVAVVNLPYACLNCLPINQLLKLVNSKRKPYELCLHCCPASVHFVQILVEFVWIIQQD